MSTSVTHSTISAAGAGSLQCPECHAPIPCIDHQHSNHFGCVACGTYFVVSAGETATIKAKKPRNWHWLNALKPGTSGVLEGTHYTITGILVKRAQNEDATWTEYLLHNPSYKNYHVLAEYNGHWTLIYETSDEHISVHNISVAIAGAEPRYEVHEENPFRIYQHYTSYTFDILSAVGEFDWDAVAEEGILEVHEYTYPGFLLTNEVNTNGSAWYKGHHIHRNNITAAFGVPSADLPEVIGNGVTDVPKIMLRQDALVRFTALLLSIIVLFGLLRPILQPERAAYYTTIDVKSDSLSWNEAKPTVSPPFELREGGGVKISMFANLSNSWLEADVNLINDNTGKTWQCTRTLEYYNGNDGGEAWTEGSNSDEIFFSNVPAGVYHLNVYPTSEKNLSNTLTLNVLEHPHMSGNFWLMVFASFIVPIIHYFRVSAIKNF